MTEVFFYISKADGDSALFDLVGRLARAAHKQQRRVYIHCCDATQCKQLDERLWCEPAGSFLPHAIGDNAPIQLGHGEAPDDQHDVLVNLAAEAPNFFGRFERVVEPIIGRDDSRRAGRQRWQYYQQRGYQMKKFDV